MPRTTASEHRFYRRSQIVWALWCTSAGPFRINLPLSAVPKVFVRRIARLLELGVGMAESRRAGQPGIDHEYTLADAFELGVALDLVDVGINQLEAAAFVRTIRRQLREQCAALEPDPLRGSHTYMVLHPKVVREALRLFDPIRPVSNYAKTIFPEPLFVPRQRLLRTIDGEEADDRPGGVRRNKCIVVIISELFLHLLDYLERAPVVKRGRH